MDCLQQPYFVFGISLMAGLYFMKPQTAFIYALITTILVKSIFELLNLCYKEGFCSSERWCPDKDRCVSEGQQGKKVQMFLDDTDNFIEELYDFIQPDAPEYVVPETEEDQKETFTPFL